MPNLRVAEHFQHGVSPYEVLSGEATFFEDVVNCRVTPAGLEPVQHPTDLRPPSMTFGWPFPQIFKTEGVGYYYLFTNGSVYQYDGSQLLLLATFPVCDNPWEMTSVYGTWIATNANKVIYQRAGQPLVVAEPTCNSVSYHNGQLFYAGLPAGTTHDLIGSMGPNTVYWSSIGGGDAFYLYEPGLVRSNERESLQYRNEHGLAYSPDGGEVLQIAPLGMNMLCYTENSVFALVPVREPVVTFSVVPLLDIGIAARRNVACSLTSHIMRARNGDFYRITGEGPVLLGFRHLGAAVDADDFIGLWNSNEQEHYFCSQATSIVFNQHGVSRLSSGYTSLVNNNATSVVVQQPSYQTSDSQVIRTLPLDFGYSGAKVLSQVDVETKGYEGYPARAVVRVYRRLHTAYGWEVREIPLPSHGTVYPRWWGDEFKVEVECWPAEAVKVTALNLVWDIGTRGDIKGMRVE